MKLLLMLVMTAWLCCPVLAQDSAQCSDYATLGEAAKVTGAAFGSAMDRRVDIKEVCDLAMQYLLAEGKFVRFLQDNKLRCNKPDSLVEQATANDRKLKASIKSMCLGH